MHATPHPPQVSIGYAHVCGVNTDSELECWGMTNNDGQMAGDNPEGLVIA